MQPRAMIKKIKDDGELDKWVAVIEQGDKEFVTGTWYNMVMVLAEDIEHQMCDITREMWEFGMQSFDWDYLYELLVREQEFAKYA